MNYTEGTKVLDGWTIIRKIGSGPSGIVYQIERKDEYGTCEQSALKVISVPQSPEDIKEILNEGISDQEASTYFDSVIRDIVHEIAIMFELKNCDHIVRHEAYKVVPHENGIGSDILIRMELLTPLSEYSLSHELDVSSVIRMGRDLADALVYCERKGLIHRDIKPQNIFITESGAFKLGDFGIARRLQQTTGVSQKGTEDYMAPEVYQRRHYGRTADIYSLGLVMYKYTNYGRLPFLPLPPTLPSFDEREQALQNRMSGVSFLPPAEAGEDLSAIILKACAYDSEQRYHSASELKADLNALLGESTVRNVNLKKVQVAKRKETLTVEQDVAEIIKSDHADQDNERADQDNRREAPEIKDEDRQPETFEREDENHQQETSEKTDSQSKESETKIPSMFEKKSITIVVLKNMLLGALPAWIFLLSCFVNIVFVRFSSKGFYTAFSCNMFSIVVMSAANLFGMKGASAWIDALTISDEENSFMKEVQYAKANKVKWQYVMKAVGIGVLVIICLPLCIIDRNSSYFYRIERIAVLASPFIMASGMISKILLTNGMRKSAAAGFMLGNLTNIILDIGYVIFLKPTSASKILQSFAFIFVISNIIAAVFYSICFVRMRLDADPGYTKRAAAKIKNTIAGGMTTAVGLLGIGILGLVVAEKGFEEAHIWRVLLSAVLISMSQGVQPVFQCCFEAKNLDLIRKVEQLSYKIIVIMAEGISVIYFIGMGISTEGIAVITVSSIMISVSYMLINIMYTLEQKREAIIFQCLGSSIVLISLVLLNRNPYVIDFPTMPECLIEVGMVVLIAKATKRCSTKYWEKHKLKTQ